MSPSPKPSITPAASAITFFSEPPSSIPMISGLVYTLNLSDIKASCIMQAISLDFAPTTAVVGIPTDTSSAWLGPESTVTVPLSPFSASNSLSMISVSVIRVSSSIPLATLTTGIFRSM